MSAEEITLLRSHLERAVARYEKAEEEVARLNGLVTESARLIAEREAARDRLAEVEEERDRLRAVERTSSAIIAFAEGRSAFVGNSHVETAVAVMAKRLQNELARVKAEAEGLRAAARDVLANDGGPPERVFDLLLLNDARRRLAALASPTLREIRESTEIGRAHQAIADARQPICECGRRGDDCTTFDGTNTHADRPSTERGAL